MPCLMTSLCLVLPLLAGGDDVPAEGKSKFDALRSYYAKAAAKYEFFQAADRKRPLAWLEKPVMKWATDDDWSGDVFVWTQGDRPQVIGCLIAAPAENRMRAVFQEFHVLSEEPIAATDMPGGYRWAPGEGLKVQRLADAPEPAATPVLRLAQMRRLTGEFEAHMEANGPWELRLLTQPLMRYQPKEGPVVDGALFTYVWGKGTDPELILLIECRKVGDALAWFYAPIRFSNRELWLRRGDKEIWRGPSHQEPTGETRMIYTTRYLETIADPQE